MTALVLSTELADAGGGTPSAASVAVAIAIETEARGHGGGTAVLLVEVGGQGGRGPTMLASDGARRLERELRDAGLEAAARGRLTWARLDAGEGWLERLHLAIEAGNADAAVVHLPPTHLREVLDSGRLRADALLLRAELPEQRAIAALAVAEAGERGLRIRIAAKAPGRVGSRRALAGIDPGGDASRRAARIAGGLLGWLPARVSPGRGGKGLASGRRHPASEAGQTVPMILGLVLALIFCTLLLAAFSGAVTGKARTQRVADLAALSAARSMRDDFERLFTPARLPDGSENPHHLTKNHYLSRAVSAAGEAAARNGVGQGRLELEFPDLLSFAPLRVRAAIKADWDVPILPKLPVEAEAEAEAVPQSAPSAGTGEMPAVASGGGYSGPLEYRQGEGMRPDVATAFDRMAAAAVDAGIALVVNDGFRSDAEQAVLWEANPDPRWVAPPGTSLHRCATELDLGPPAATPWLAANAPRFGFVQRYWWEDWHFGYDAGPAPCSPEGERVGADSQTDSPGAVPDAGRGSSSDGNEPLSLPSYVPARFRGAISAAATRWNVSPALLAAQLMAESNFNPFAVSPAGASGIAQFMPATAASYGLSDPFDAEASIEAQAHLMSDLLGDFGDISLALAAYNAGPAPVEACSCVPSYPETQAYVARILALMNGAGAIAAAPALEVRLVE